MAGNVDFLRRVPWLAELDEGSLDALANSATEQSYQPGEVILRQGDPGAGAFIIKTGKVQVVQSRDGQEVALAALGPGDVIGEMALLDEFPRSASARALEPTTALGLMRWHFRGILESHPQIALALLPILSRRVRQAEAGRAEASAKH